MLPTKKFTAERKISTNRKQPLSKVRPQEKVIETSFTMPFFGTSMLGNEIKGNDIWISRRPSCIS